MRRTASYREPQQNLLSKCDLHVTSHENSNRRETNPRDHHQTTYKEQAAFTFWSWSTLKSPYSGNIFYRKIHYLTRELHVKFHAKNRYRAISVFQVKFNMEFTSQVMNFPWIVKPSFKMKRLCECCNIQRVPTKNHSRWINGQDCQERANRNPATIRKLYLKFVVGKPSFSNSLNKIYTNVTT